MTSRLDRFRAAAEARVAAGQYTLHGPRLAPHGSLAAALAAHPTPVIAELKPSSPSGGRLLQGPAQRVLHDYRDGGAAALSVLADADHFDGSPDLVRSAHVLGLPVLWKDFVVATAQIDAAAHCGASALLLIERLFADPADREALVDAAQAAGLEVLLECFDAADAARARTSGADLLGVNARDLETLAVDLDRALDIVRDLAQDRPVVALSGIGTRADRRHAMDAGAMAVLVGSSLLRAPDRRLALRALQRPLAKVCGLRTAEDVAAAADAGADLVGFVVGSPQSPRDLPALQAQRLNDLAHARGLRTVLVTSHTDDWEVREWCRLVRPDYLQFHGLHPSPEWLHSLGAIPTIPLPAVAPGTPVPDGPFVLDASMGTGAPTDLMPAAQTLGGASDRMTLLAGGLAPATVADAIRHTGAWGADASSGLESAPGVKDPARVRAFVEACHAA